MIHLDTNTRASSPTSSPASPPLPRPFFPSSFIKASMDFIVGCCCSTWYFAPKDEHGKAQVSWPIFHAIGFVFRYHLGSLAFGSFIVAVIQLIKWIVEYVTTPCNACNKC